MPPPRLRRAQVGDPQSWSPISCHQEAPPQGSRAGAAWTGVPRHLAPLFGGSGSVVTGSLAGLMALTLVGFENAPHWTTRFLLWWEVGR